MSPDEVEQRFRECLARLPDPAGIPPASANPKLFEIGNELVMKVIQIMSRFGIISPTIPPPPPPPPGPMTSPTP